MSSTGEEIPVGAEGVDGGESGAAGAPESEAAQLGLFGDAAPDGVDNLWMYLEIDPPKEAAA